MIKFRSVKCLVCVGNCLMRDYSTLKICALSKKREKELGRMLWCCDARLSGERR